MDSDMAVPQVYNDMPPAKTTAQDKVPANNSRRVPQTRRARTVSRAGRAGSEALVLKALKGTMFQDVLRVKRGDST